MDVININPSHLHFIVHENTIDELLCKLLSESNEHISYDYYPLIGKKIQNLSFDHSISHHDSVIFVIDDWSSELIDKNSILVSRNLSQRIIDLYTICDILLNIKSCPLEDLELDIPYETDNITIKRLCDILNIKCTHDNNIETEISPIEYAFTITHHLKSFAAEMLQQPLC